MTAPSRSEDINELALSLSMAQGEFRAARMDAINPFLKNHYADLGSIIEAAKLSLAKNGLAVSQPASTDGSSVTVTTILMHCSGQWISSDMTLPLGDEKGRNLAQAAGSIITYLRRYSLSAMVGIYADEDTDGEKPKGEQPKNTPAKAQDSAEHVSIPANLEPVDVDLATNSKGELLIDFTTDKLAFMANSLMKSLKDNGLSPIEKESKRNELKAIETIIADRNAATKK